MSTESSQNTNYYTKASWFLTYKHWTTGVWNENKNKNMTAKLIIIPQNEILKYKPEKICSVTICEKFSLRKSK